MSQVRQTQANGLLSGIRVVEIVAPWGEYTGKLLADLGAEVVKIEPSDGSASRRQAPLLGDRPDQLRSLPFAYYNTNKKSIALDLQSRGGHVQLMELLATADVLLTTFDGGRSSLFPADPRTLRDLNPRLVTTCLSGFGASGPAAMYRVSNAGVYAMSGQMQAVGEPEGPPTAPPGQMALDLAAIDACTGTLLAIVARVRTGRGQHVDVAASEVLAGQNSSPDQDARQRSGNTHPLLAPSGLYRCRNGAVEITIVMPSQWDALKELLNPCPELNEPTWNDRGARARDHLDIEAIIASKLRERDQPALVAEAQRLRLPCLPVHTVSSFMTDDQVRARSFFVRIGQDGEQPDLLAGPPYRLSAGGWQMRSAAPRLGEHTREVLDELAQQQAVRTRSDQPLPGPRPETAPVGALAGLRVVTFSTAFAGPTLSRYLADYGAEVIKVESKRRPDNIRGPERDYVEPGGVTTSVQFNHFNRNKCDLAVDMSREEGRSIVRSLLSRTDVVVDNFSISVMKKWGLDYPQVTAIKPDIIMLDMQGLGQTGPHRDYITYGPTLHSYTGLTSVWGFTHPWFVDYVAAEHGVVAVLAALWRRMQTGRGMHIDLAQAEALAALLGTWYLAAAAVEHAVKLTEVPAHDSCYPCRESDTWCAIRIETQRDWEVVVGVAGRPAWTTSSDFATPAQRATHAADLNARMASWTRQHAALDLEHHLQSAGVAAVAVRTPDQLFDDPQFVERRYFVPLEHPIIGLRDYAGLPIHLSDTPGRIWRSAPLLGQDNTYVLREILHLSDEAIADLHSQGVLE